MDGDAPRKYKKRKWPFPTFPRDTVGPRRSVDGQLYKKSRECDETPSETRTDAPRTSRANLRLLAT